jgi:hypothetical protein
VIFSTLLQAHSKTMFIPRLITADEVFELAETNYQFHTNKTSIRSVIAFKPFYQSSHAGSSLARFFLPCNKRYSAVREDGMGDINPLWFNLISSDDTLYSSTLSLRPERTSMGMVLTWYADLYPCVPHLWFGLNTAVVHTRHNLHVREFNRTSPGVLSGFENMCDALNNSDWTAGKLSCRSQSCTGLDDIQLKLGYDCVDACDMHMSPYLVGTIPTGKRPRARYLFEPLVGSTHGSLGLGLNVDVVLYSALSCMVDAKYSYGFAGHECRSFDLHNGDWSRYLLVVTQSEPFYTYPGINSFTKTVRVRPGSTFQLWSALHYECASCQLEVGYNFWLRGKEKIRITSCTVSLPYDTAPIGIFDMQTCTAPVTTAHTAMIQQSIIGTNPVVGDGAFVATSIGDFDMNSASNSQAVSNTLYASCGYQFSCVPLFLAIHGSYEFANSRGAISQYAVWGCLTILF